MIELTEAQTTILARAHAKRTTYKVLAALLANPDKSQTQRELAAAAGVGLGTVNRSIAHLAELGLIAIHKLSDGNTVRYSAVPKNGTSAQRRDVPEIGTIYRVPRSAVPLRPGIEWYWYVAYLPYFNPHLTEPERVIRWLDVRHDPVDNAYRGTALVIVEPGGTLTPGDPLPFLIPESELGWHDTTFDEEPPGWYKRVLRGERKASDPAPESLDMSYAHIEAEMRGRILDNASRPINEWQLAPPRRDTNEEGGQP